MQGDAGKQGERQQILANFRNPPDSWLEHNDPFVKANVSMALSVESMLQLSQAFEVAGDYGRAARVSWATTFLNLRAPRLLLNRARRDLVYRLGQWEEPFAGKAVCAGLARIANKKLPTECPHLCGRAEELHPFAMQEGPHADFEGS